MLINICGLMCFSVIMVHHAVSFSPVCPERVDVRLAGGSSRCAGHVEMFHTGEWRKVRSDEWPMRAAAVVCRQLDCGSAAAATNKKSARDTRNWGVGVKCTGSEAALRECWNTYDDGFRLEVICSGNAANERRCLSDFLAGDY